jgi:hypothetical protein
MTKVKTPTSEWLREKLDRLVDMTEIVSKENPEQYTEPDPANTSTLSTTLTSLLVQD